MYGIGEGVYWISWICYYMMYVLVAVSAILIGIGHWTKLFEDCNYGNSRLDKQNLYF